MLTTTGGTFYLLIIIGNIVSAFGQECEQRDEVAAGRDCERGCRPDGTCRKQNRECVCDGLCGLSCLRKRCPPISAPLNGNVVMNPNDTIIGAEVTYSCDDGYEISGPTNRVCQANKTWSATQPTCIEFRVEETCDENDLSVNDLQIEFKYPVGSRQNVELARRKPPGTIARFKCGHVGYAIVGINAKVCQGGEWRVPEPTCERVPCPAMEFNGGILEYRDENNRIVEQPHHGDLRIATCPDGHTLKGVSQTQCSAGVWLDELPTCEQNIPLCSNETIANGIATFEDAHSITADPSHGVWRHFTCGQGYSIVGEQRSQCLDGVWTSEKPACVEDSCPAVANNGDYQHIYYQGRRSPPDLTFSADTIVEVDCAEGRVPEGPRMSVCRRGLWNPPRLLCVQADEQCIRNETEIQVQNRRCKRQCESNGDCPRGRSCVCDDICGRSCIPIERANYCEDLPSDQSVQVRITPNNRTFGSIAQSECGNDHEIVGGSSERRCLGSGQWSGDPLTCIHRGYSECGISRNTVSRGRIVGGNNANPGAWPWQVYLDIRRGAQQYSCGGVLIDRNWVLTSASCIPHNQEYRIIAVLGMTNLSKPRHQEIEVEEAIPHPGYEADRIPLTYQNNIALLKLNRSAELNERVRIVCLPDKTRANRLIPPEPSGLHVATITGWGHTNVRSVTVSTPSQSSNQLQQLALPLKSREDCRNSLEGDRELQFFDDSMFCAGYDRAPFGACTGDSGGPFVKKAVRNKHRRWTLIGLTSWGRGCGLPNELDFFTNVPYFIDWITETMELQEGD